MAQTVEEARAALDAAEAKLASAGTTRERIAASREAADARRALQQANAAARAEAAAAREEASAAARAKAEAERPKTGQEMAAQLMGVRPITKEEEGGPFTGYVQYQELDEAGRRAIFGINPATGKAYTNEESAAANAGYNPYADAIGYEIDPRTGNLNVLTSQGTVMTTGAKYERNAQGNIVPQAGSRPPGVGYDAEGRSYEANQRMPGESIESWLGRLAARFGPGALSEGGKTYIYDASGQFYIQGETNPPAGFGTTAAISGGTVNLPYTGGASTANLPYTGNAGVRNLATGNVSTGRNPYKPGTTEYDKFEERRSAFDILYNEFDSMGLGSLVKPLERLIMQNVGDQQFAIELRASDEYKARFFANEERQRKGLRVLSPREYLAVEDSYRQVLRSYGLRQFDNDQYVQQFIANDISSAELSDRVSMAVQRVQNADPTISRTLRDYYGISNTDLVGYVLDPNQQLQKIQRQIAAAEIGTAARVQGLEPGVGVSEQLAAQGITQAQAQRGYATIADVLPTAEKLSQIYGATMEGYDMAQAEQEVFNQLASAQRRRERLTQREVAQFSGQSGLGRASLTQESRGQF